MHDLNHLPFCNRSDLNLTLLVSRSDGPGPSGGHPLAPRTLASHTTVSRANIYARSLEQAGWLPQQQQT